MTDTTEVLQLERAAFRAFPAEVETTVGGFICRTTRDGVARRWNSATTIPGVTMAAMADLPQVEEFYHNAGRPPLVRVLSVVDHRLDLSLHELRWRAEAETTVCSALIDGSAGSLESVASEPTAAWCRLKARSRDMTEPQLDAWLQRTRDIAGSVGYVQSVDDDGDVVGIGVGVADEGWLGVFDMYVEPRHRQRGRGTALLADLLAWGRSKHCSHAYLQVTLDNEVALDMYAGFGFEERYRYWYRRKTEAGAI